MRVLAQEIKCNPVAVSIAVDVSGSMKTTDLEGLTDDLLNLFVDSMREDDFLGVVLYNDTIVYNSGLVPLNDADAVAELRDNINSMSYYGDTDNGMGLLEATKNLTESDYEFTEKYVFLISDGDTDIPEGSGRTKANSDADLALSSELASEENIIINAVEYTDSVQQDTTTLSLITSATGGSTTIVNDKSQYIQVMMNLFYSSVHQGKVVFRDISSESLVYRTDFSFEESENYEYQGIVFSSEPIKDLEISDSKVNMENHAHYIFLTDESGAIKDISAIFSVNEKSVIVSGTVKVAKVFEKEPDVKVIVVHSPEEETDVSPEIVENSPIKWNEISVYIIIGVIVLVTIGICILIVKRILFHKKKLSRIQGYLELKFIDLKSANESKDIKWDLSEYPPEGVTLSELFSGAGIKEHLTDLDKICFYPSEHGNELILVHCMDGGIFKGNMLIKRNIAETVKNGDILFVSFSDNASEISITYHSA